MNDLETPLQLFLSGFAARDIADPLASFDETTSGNTVAQVMREQHLGVCAIRAGGFNVGWLTLDEFNPSHQPVPHRPFTASSVVADSASLNIVVQALNDQPVVFVKSLGQICGLIRRSNLDRPAMRMWLFGLVTITELRVTALIDEFCPHESWRQYLSDGRLKLAEELQCERRRRGENPTLLECLQVADKGQIVARDPKLRSDTRFSSRRAVEEFVKQLQHLRNNLAHAQGISSDWDVILDLATNIHRVVLGPASTELMNTPP